MVQREIVGNKNDDTDEELLSLFLNRIDQLLPGWAVGTSCKLFPSLGSTLFKCGLLPWLLVHRRV